MSINLADKAFLIKLTKNVLYKNQKTSVVNLIRWLPSNGVICCVI